MPKSVNLKSFPYFKLFQKPLQQIVAFARTALVQITESEKIFPNVTTKITYNSLKIKAGYITFCSDNSLLWNVLQLYVAIALKTFRWVDVPTYGFFPAVTSLASVMFNVNRSVHHEKLSKLSIFSFFSNIEIKNFHEYLSCHTLYLSCHTLYLSCQDNLCLHCNLKHYNSSKQMLLENNLTLKAEVGIIVAKRRVAGNLKA